MQVHLSGSLCRFSLQIDVAQPEIMSFSLHKVFTDSKRSGCVMLVAAIVALSHPDAELRNGLQTFVVFGPKVFNGGP